MIENLPKNLIEFIETGESTIVEYKEAKKICLVVCLNQFVQC